MTGTVMVRLKPYDQRCSIVTQRRLRTPRYNFPPAPVGALFFFWNHIYPGVETPRLHNHVPSGQEIRKPPGAKACTRRTVTLALSFRCRDTSGRDSTTRRPTNQTDSHLSYSPGYGVRQVGGSSRAMRR